jgi:hypothetical protein
MDEHDPRAARDRGTGTPPAEGVGDTMLHPEEREAYGTDLAAGSGRGDGPGFTPGAEPRPWLLVGIALLVAFLAILAWAVIEPALAVGASVAPG